MFTDAKPCRRAVIAACLGTSDRPALTGAALLALQRRTAGANTKLHRQKGGSGGCVGATSGSRLLDLSSYKQRTDIPRKRFSGVGCPACALF
jgi:hypothetical protein